jgi:AAHS family 4-hydroxybenzoate transporter-like MFS transporter
MMAIGRFGGIAGSFLVAELARRQLDFGSIFAVIGFAGVIAALALVIKQLAHPETASEHAVAQEETHQPGEEVLSH